MVDPILDKARAGQNILERLMNAIPGFKGYREKELRRDTDKVLREYLATRLDLGKKGLDQVAVSATRAKTLDVINDVETARKRIDKVAQKIRYADRGYSGVFDRVKIDEAVLERVHAFDASLLEVVESIRQGASAAPTSPDIRAALAALVAEIDALDSRLSEREALLAGVR
jgi:hypothetical protein